MTHNRLLFEKKIRSLFLSIGQIVPSELTFLHLDICDPNIENITLNDTPAAKNV